MKKILSAIGIASSLAISSCNNTNNAEKITHDISQQITENNNPTNTTETNDTLPNNFKIKEGIVSWGTDFTIPNFGKVEEKTMNLETTFELKDANKKTIAKAYKKLFSLGVVINIEDATGKPIGSIEEEIIKSLLSIKTHYSIKDGSGNIIGKSKKLSFIGTDIDIYDNSDNLIVSCERDMINMVIDTWTVDIKNAGIDKRIIAFIPCYKTVADNQRSKKD